MVPVITLHDMLEDIRHDKDYIISCTGHEYSKKIGEYSYKYRNVILETFVSYRNYRKNEFLTDFTRIILNSDSNKNIFEQLKLQPDEYQYYAIFNKEANINNELPLFIYGIDNDLSDSEKFAFINTIEYTIGMYDLKEDL